MKKYRNIIKLQVLAMLVEVGGFFSSCEKFLEVNPSDQLTVNSYDDVRRLMGAYLQNHVSGTGEIYFSGARPFYLNDKEMLIMHFYSDDYDPSTYLLTSVGSNNSTDLVASANWAHTGIHTTLWTLYYSNIGFYNVVLDELRKNPGTTAQNEQVSGEARVLRAWQFFRLMQYFSPYKLNELGLPLNTDPEKVQDYDSRRRTQTECYDFITSELEAVLAYTAEPSSTYNIFYNKRVINGLLAQVYHYKAGSGAGSSADYDKAIAYAKATLALGVDYATKFTPPTSAASIGVSTTGTRAAISIMHEGVRIEHLYNTVGYWRYGGNRQYASDTLFSLYKNEDSRKALYFAPDKEIIKYESDEYSPYYCIWEFFTGAEMQLIIAESYARKGDDTNALAALNAFAATRYTAYDRSADASVLESILKERRLEFCFDYTMRWMDLSRLQPAMEREVAGTTYTLEAGSYKYCLPIPRVAELERNPINQNPGWGTF